MHIVGLCASGSVSDCFSGASGGASAWRRGCCCATVFKELWTLYGFTAISCSECGMPECFDQSQRALDSSSFLFHHYS